MNIFEKILLVVGGKLILENLLDADNEKQNYEKHTNELKMKCKNAVEESRKLRKTVEKFCKKETEWKKDPLWNASDDKLLPEVVEWLNSDRNRRKKRS
jgi:hypothetical protein